MGWARGYRQEIQGCVRLVEEIGGAQHLGADVEYHRLCLRRIATRVTRLATCPVIWQSLYACGSARGL